MQPEIQQVIDAVKQASPYLWSVAYRQVWVDVACMSAWGIFLFGISAYCKKLSKGREEEGYFFAMLGHVLALVIGFGLISSAIYYSANPGYQAIGELTDLLKK
jgi:hypothetical protein